MQSFTATLHFPIFTLLQESLRKQSGAQKTKSVLKLTVNA